MSTYDEMVRFKIEMSIKAIKSQVSIFDAVNDVKWKTWYFFTSCSNRLMDDSSCRERVSY
jgi:hypothetical protein